MVILKNRSGNPRQIYEVKIIGLVDYFALGYSKDDNSVPSFGIMNIEVADPVFVALNTFALKEKNPTSCYLVKMESTENHDDLIEQLLSDLSLPYLDLYECLSFTDVIRHQGLSEELLFTPQILGSVAISSIILTIFGFVRINATLTPEEEQDYALLRKIGIDKTHLYLITFAENSLLIITTLITGFISSLFISFSLNVMFLPKTALPKIFDITGILDSTIASLLSLLVLFIIIMIAIIIPGMRVILSNNYQKSNYESEIQSKSKLLGITSNPKRAIFVTILLLVILVALVTTYTDSIFLNAVILTLINPWLKLNDFSAFNINLLFYGLFIGLILSIFVRTRRIIKATSDFTGRQQAGLSDQLHRG